MLCNKTIAPIRSLPSVNGITKISITAAGLSYSVLRSDFPLKEVCQDSSVGKFSPLCKLANTAPKFSPSNSFSNPTLLSAERAFGDAKKIVPLTSNLIKPSPTLGADSELYKLFLIGNVPSATIL